MEKYGVACKCASGEVNAKEMTKLADGSHQCRECGRTYKLDTIKLSDQVRIVEKEAKIPK